jgi:hypothetical protein
MIVLKCNFSTELKELVLKTVAEHGEEFTIKQLLDHGWSTSVAEAYIKHIKKWRKHEQAV